MKCRVPTYKQFVRAFCCLVPGCYTKPVEYEHHPTKGARGNVDHDRGWPCCRKHHDELNGGRQSFQRKYVMDLNRDVDWLQREYRRLYPMGPEFIQVAPWREVDAEPSRPRRKKRRRRSHPKGSRRVSQTA